MSFKKNKQSNEYRYNGGPGKFPYTYNRMWWWTDEVMERRSGSFAILCYNWVLNIVFWFTSANCSILGGSGTFEPWDLVGWWRPLGVCLEGDAGLWCSLLPDKPQLHVFPAMIVRNQDSRGIFCPLGCFCQVFCCRDEEHITQSDRQGMRLCNPSWA